MFELMPVDSRGNVYIKAQSNPGNTGNASIYVISNNGTQTSPPRPYVLEYDPATHTAAQDGILYNAIPIYVKTDGTKITLDDLGTYAISAYDLKNGTILWSYRLPVDARHNAMANNNLLYGAILGTGTDIEYRDLVRTTRSDELYSPTGVGSTAHIDIIPSTNTVYINFRSATFEYPVVLNRSRCIYSSNIYAIQNNGNVLYNSPQDSIITSMAVNNSTLFAFGSDGKMAAIAIGGIAGIALLAALALGLKFLLAGTVTRARSRVDKNENRNLVLAYIKEHPGNTLYEISRGIEMNMGTVRYHVLILGLNHKIATFNDGKFVRYFPNSNFYSKEEQLIISLIRRETMGKIIQMLMVTPGLTNTELSKALEHPNSAISKLTKELCMRGIAVREELGDERADGKFAYSIKSDFVEKTADLSHRLKNE
jgi:predicted transcriptional regulator